MPSLEGGKLPARPVKPHRPQAGRLPGHAKPKAHAHLPPHLTQLVVEKLDVTGAAASLQQLTCSSNCSLTSLIVDACSQLTHLRCTALRQLTAVELGSCRKLIEIDVGGCGLEAVDLAACSQLTPLSCASNKLKALELSVCIRLATLDCDLNQVTAIDLTNCSHLESLNFNCLPALNLVANIGCSQKFLTALDLTHQPELQMLDAAWQRSAAGLSLCRLQQGGALSRLVISPVNGALPEGIASLASLRNLKLSGDSLPPLLDLTASLSHLGIASLAWYSVLLPDAWEPPVSALPSLRAIELLACRGILSLTYRGTSLRSLRLGFLKSLQHLTRHRLPKGGLLYYVLNENVTMDVDGCKLPQGAPSAFLGL
jgi:hypothetical protein